MKQLIACCGLDCESCDARIATVENDNELKEKTARKFAYCSEYCEIRKCVQKKGFNTCGDCMELDTCQIVGSIFQHAPAAKENLKQ